MINALIYGGGMCVALMIGGLVKLRITDACYRRIENPMDRFHTILARGGAISCVILSHIGNASGLRWFAPLGGCGCVVFLILSGYGLEASYQKDQKMISFWKKRLLTVWMPYCLVSIIGGLIFHTFHTPTEFVLNILLIKPKHPFGWYMTFIFIQYLFFYLVHRWIDKNRIRYIIYLIAALMTLWVPNELYGEQAFSFFIGILICEAKDRKRFFKMKMCVIYFCTFLIFFVTKQVFCGWFSAGVLLNAVQMMYKTALAMLVIGVLYWVGTENRKIKGTYGVIQSVLLEGVASAGMISYELYLIHGYFWAYLAQGTIGKMLIFYFGCVSFSIMLYGFSHVCRKRMMKRA